MARAYVPRWTTPALPRRGDSLVGTRFAVVPQPRRGKRVPVKRDVKRFSRTLPRRGGEPCVTASPFGVPPMTILSFALVSGAALLAAGNASAGVTIHVPKDFPTIQEAIDAAVETDVIMISNGQYRENLVLMTPGVTLKATGKNVFVDGAYEGNCLEVT